jgi:beta-galactosidase
MNGYKFVTNKQILELNSKIIPNFEFLNVLLFNYKIQLLKTTISLNKKSLLLIVVLFIQFLVFSQRSEINIGNLKWRSWMDTEATWKTDSLYLSTLTKISNIPSNKPTCGWDNLYKTKGKICSLPAIFEGIFGNGDPKFRYHGVGWFTTEVDIPANWNGKTIQLEIEKARLRVEVYVNEKLVGYDIVAETPFSVPISEALIAGKKNRIAFRITNPDGQRGWNDGPVTEWGTKYKLIPSHDFGGIGNVNLLATSKCYVNDIFVKNILPANEKKVQVQVELNNTTKVDKTTTIELQITATNSQTAVYTKSWSFNATKESISKFVQKIQVPEAKLWDIDHPNLYYCKVKINGEEVSDTHQVRFGFRTFEAKANEKGQHNYYLNGKRIRIKSAIDWGYYWQTGFYATDEMAKKSVENAKAIGHNCISFHRTIGDPLVMKYADELGLLTYEEPGGMNGVDDLRTPTWIYGVPKDKQYYCAVTFPQKFSRMVIRDRNHPSLVIFSLVNEQCTYDTLHKKILEEAQKLDDSRLITNQSGGQYGDFSSHVPHFRPYDNHPRLDYQDDHTVMAKSRFQEDDLKAHYTVNDSAIIYWGEVRCYCGPDNYYLLSKPKDTVGYDYKSWLDLGKKTEAYFKQNDFTNHPNIKSPADLSKQAGRGLMYIDGRLGQSIQFSNTEDGFAINGWSGDNQLLHNDFLAWNSAICDEGRNLKGPASDYSYWLRPLQIGIARQNGKYFNPNEEAKFNVYLFNEYKIEKGDYTLQLKVKDGNGNYTDFNYEKKIQVTGGDDFTQKLEDNFAVKIKDSWKAGYLTIEGKLFKNGKEITNGTEQILLKNRQSFTADFKDKKIAILNWEGAEKALQESGISFNKYQEDQAVKTILAGKPTDAATLTSLLKKVNTGAKLIVRFDADWANLFYETKILKEKVTTWGGYQKDFWNGNGWGYLEKFVGNQPINGASCIGTNSWEVPEDPKGFEPFVSNFKQKSYGAFFNRPDQLLTLSGEITYGKGSIILAPSYPVDLENAFSDMLFFNMLK